MAEVNTFLEKIESRNWENVIDNYENILHAKAKTKTKSSATKELTELDFWYQSELLSSIKKRQDGYYMTQEELVKLMKWKLARGKFRPRLVELAGSNSESDVIAKTKAAFTKAKSGKLKAAIECLTPLKGIGPATASAVLAAGCPEEAAFMADEPTRAILGTTSLKYTLPEYIAYMDGVKDCLRTLKEQNPSYGWTAHKVELALWGYCIAKSLNVNITKGTKRKSADEEAKAVRKKKC